MTVDERLYDTPGNEEEAGEGACGFRISRRIAGALCAEQSVNQYSAYIIALP